MPIRVPNSESPELSIVVLFTHDPVLATRCAESIAAVAEELPATETIFLLGGSSPAVRDVIGAVEGARVIDSPQNLGTAVGWTLGFNAARGRRILLMHEDAEATPGMTPSLLETLDANPDAAIAGPWLTELGGEEASSCGWVWFRDQAQTRVAREYMPEDLIGAPYAVDGVSSAISMWDRQSWLEGGGFDERNFPALGVDADACTSAWARGRSVLIDPRVTGIHRTGAMDDAPGRLSGKFVRYFMLERFKRLWFEKWGAMADWFAELPEGAAPGSVEDASLRIAQRRRRERPRIPGEFPLPHHPFTDPDGTGAMPAEVDAAMLDRLARAEAAAMDEYHLWLIKHSERQQAEIEELAAAVRTGSARESHLAEQLTAIHAGRYWRLRTKARKLLGIKG
ncbi:MAG: glycosyltransferase [Solirubrobacterales bacterium]